MEKQKEKIMRFSKVVHTLLSVVFILLIIAGALLAIAGIWQIANLNTTTMIIAGNEVEVPLLFRVGSVDVLLPITWETDYNFAFSEFIPVISPNDFWQTILSIVAIGFAKIVFRLLREDGSPFCEGIVKSLKRMAIALLIMGVVSGLTAVLAAGVVWVLCLIFDYGCSLQNESDTTL